MTKKDLTVWSDSPVGRLLNARRFSDIFREFDNSFRDWNLDMKTFTDLQPKAKFPKVNVIEADEAYEVEIAIAGFDKEDVSLELKDNCLYIKADKTEEVSDEGRKYLMKEISSRSFRRALSLPARVLTDDIVCNSKDGVITCVLKKEAVQIPEDDIVKIEVK